MEKNTWNKLKVNVWYFLNTFNENKTIERLFSNVRINFQFYFDQISYTKRVHSHKQSKPVRVLDKGSWRIIQARLVN